MEEIKDSRKRKREDDDESSIKKRKTQDKEETESSDVEMEDDDENYITVINQSHFLLPLHLATDSAIKAYTEKPKKEEPNEVSEYPKKYRWTTEKRYKPQEKEHTKHLRILPTTKADEKAPSKPINGIPNFLRTRAYGQHLMTSSFKIHSENAPNVTKTLTLKKGAFVSMPAIPYQAKEKGAKAINTYWAEIIEILAKYYPDEKTQYRKFAQLQLNLLGIPCEDFSLKELNSNELKKCKKYALESIAIMAFAESHRNPIMYPITIMYLKLIEANKITPWDVFLKPESFQMITPRKRPSPYFESPPSGKKRRKKNKKNKTYTPEAEEKEEDITEHVTHRKATIPTSDFGEGPFWSRQGEPHRTREFPGYIRGSKADLEPYLSIETDDFLGGPKYAFPGLGTSQNMLQKIAMEHGDHKKNWPLKKRLGKSEKYKIERIKLNRNQKVHAERMEEIIRLYLEMWAEKDKNLQEILVDAHKDPIDFDKMMKRFFLENIFQTTEEKKQEIKKEKISKYIK